MADTIRRQAARALQSILYEGAYSSLLIDRALKAMPDGTSERDRRFFTGLIYTTLEHLPTVDAVLDASSSVKTEKMKPWVAVNLRMALAQILYMDRVPASAAVNAAVELVRDSACSRLSGFVNGVLRGCGRTGYAFERPDPAAEPLRALSLEYDMPEWIVSLWRDAYGEEVCRALLARSRGEKPLSVRANTLKITPDELFARLKEELGEDRVRRSELLPEVFYPAYEASFSDWSLYREGLLYAQDESSVLAAMALRAEPGQKVLDLCAAPGGKTAVLAQMMNDQGRIDSRDLHPQRVRLIEEMTERLGIGCVRASAADGTDPSSVSEGAYDAVLLDAPCSGLGVLRSKPDIKYRRSASDALALSAVQEKLLETAARALRPGGRLVYSTCSLHPEENEKRIEAFLAAHPNFSLVDLEKELPSIGECDKISHKYMIIFPVEQGRDGFFVAALQKSL